VDPHGDETIVVTRPTELIDNQEVEVRREK
jgi:hypothetical protein